jgi:hypothetical protein
MMSFAPIALQMCLLLALFLTTTTEAFAPLGPIHQVAQHQQYLATTSSPSSSTSSTSSSSLKMLLGMPEGLADSSLQLSASTLDPTTALSDLLGGLLGSPAILLVPIGAALAVASLIAFFIVSYANPEVEDDEK